MYYVYILRTSSDTLYIGYTSDLNRRIKEHRSKGSRSAKYLKYYDSFELVYHEEYDKKGEAMSREAQLKSWSKEEKETLVRSN